MATMPILDDMPPVRTDKTCWEWADREAADADVTQMWGILEDGSSDRAIAVRRLAENCEGKPKPEIMGVGSSAGYDEFYCRKHSQQKICMMIPNHR
jgi:hypothetical protein